MTFEAGPWNAFGQNVLAKLVEQSVTVSQEGNALGSIGFMPDYTVVIRESCTFLDIPASAYRNARKATLLSREFK